MWIVKSNYFWQNQHHYQICQNVNSLMQDYENDALNNLKKILINKWDFVTMQAEEQVINWYGVFLIQNIAAAFMCG